MKFSEYIDIINKDPFFEHDIVNVDGREPIDGFSIDLRSVTNNYVLKNSIHFHKFLELEVIVSGTGIHQINGQSISAHRGYVSLTRRTDFHSWKFDDSKQTELYNIAFTEEHISSWVANQFQKFEHVMDCFLGEDELAEIIPLFKLLHSEFRNPDDNFKTMRKSLLNAILVFFMRHISVGITNKVGAKNILIQKVLYYIEEHFTENDISLYIVSDKLDITPNYLGKVIRETIGMSFNEYVTDRRLSYSLKLLNQSFLSINKVAEKSGFSSSTYYISVFKKAYGVTPKQYLLNINK